MVGWHHRLDGHEFEQIPADGEGQGSLVCCCPRGRKESDTTERLNQSLGEDRATGWEDWGAMAHCRGPPKEHLL